MHHTPQNHPIVTENGVTHECWEHNESMFYSLWWIGNAKAHNIGKHNLNFSPTVLILTPWRFISPSIDTDNEQRGELISALNKQKRHDIVGNL